MISKFLLSKFPEQFKQTAFVRYFGFTKIPLIYFVSPTVIQLDEQSCIIKIPLNRRTRNHLSSMYFGVLATGADLAGGLGAMKEISDSKMNIALSFKDFHADFLRRAEGDVHFICRQMKDIKIFVQEVIETGERKNFKVLIDAIVPSENSEPVARFTLTLSLKLKK